MSLTVNIIHLAQVLACHTPNQLLWPIILATVGAILVFSGASAPGIVIVASTIVEMLVAGGASFHAIAAAISCCAFNLYIERGQDARTTIILRFPLVQSSCASA